MTIKQDILHKTIEEYFGDEKVPVGSPKLPPMRLFVVRRPFYRKPEEITIAAHLCTIVDGKLCFFEFRPVQDDLGGLGQFMHRAFSEWIDVEEIQIPGGGSKVVN